MVESAKIYEKVGVNGLAKRTSRKRTAALLRKIIPLLSKKDKILDVGCGYGRVGLELERKGFDVDGIDISPNLINHAKQVSQDPSRFIVGDIRKLAYKKESFDKIICLWSVFNEITNKKDQIKSLSEIHRVLGPSGEAIIDIINGETMFMKIVASISRIYYGENESDIWVSKVRCMDGKHLKVKYFMYTKKYLSGLIKDAGFSKFSFENKKIAGRNRIFILLHKS